jgi:hypothetical protein
MDGSKNLNWNGRLFPNTGTTGPTGIVGPTGVTGCTGPYGVAGSTFSTLFTSSFKTTFMANATYQSFGNTTFVANITTTLGTPSTLQYSLNGYTWQAPSALALGNTYIGKVVYANNTFVAYNANNNGSVSNNDILTSTDGQTWTPSFVSRGGKTITKIISCCTSTRNCLLWTKQL